jgi:hypothetical protein
VVYPSISLSTSHTSVAENSGTTVTLTATSSIAASEDITVTLATTGTATNGTDYSSVNNQTITISASATTGTKTFTVTDDSVYDGDETIIVAISTVSGASATESGTQSVTTTITENESSPTVQISSSAASVYDNGSSLTITATASQEADQAITVVIGTSGTATEGTDYATVSDITIAAGQIEGTATFDPTSDTVNEGSETAIIAISSVSGADSAKGSTTSVTITINEYALRATTAFTEGTTAEQNTIKNRSTWTAIEAAGATHPYEQMGIHKVQSFSKDGVYLTGAGETIHIADFYCDTNHDIYDNKTITNLDDGGSGESTFGSATSSNNHCQGVAMFAAGDVGARSGVAPDADLILSSIPDFEGTNEGDDYARDLDAARVAGAIASNQSWGYDVGGTSYNISEFKSYISSNGLSNAEGLAVLMHGSSSGQDLTDANTFVTALNNFESSGVIVWAAANDSGETDASAMAALPELFSDLGEAWIVANVVQYTGDSDLSDATSSEFTLKGNKCGSTAEYCLSVDGWDVYAATYVDSGTSKYNTSRTSYGSSWSAPMVSGGVALMSQAFPNHTPEQLVDRILASANNVWFTPDGNTTFTTHGNSITHGYHSTWGQGIPDFYAALSPITSNANPAMALYTGDSIQSSSAQPFPSSSITPSVSFGDALSAGLVGEVGYAYDALSGGFKYDMSTRVNMTNNDVPSFNLSSELSKLDLQLHRGNNSDWKENFSQVLSTLSKRDGLETTLTLGANSLPLQSFFGSNFDSSVDLSDFRTPYMESGEGGIGLSANYKLGNSRLLIGATNPIAQNNFTNNIIGSRKTLVASLEHGNKLDGAFTFMAGVTKDKDSLLGTRGSNAYTLSGAKSDTSFAALKAQSLVNNELTLIGVATIAKTDMTSPDSSFINSASNIRSSSFGLIADKNNLLGDDSLSLSVIQPNRVSGGGMSISLSNLAQSDGNITYRNKSISLEPTGRQLTYGLSYSKDFGKDISFSIKNSITKSLNHKQDANTVNSGYVGAKYKNLKVGFAKNSAHSINSELLYSYIF